MDGRRVASQEALIGVDYDGSVARSGWLLIDNEHMRLLVPPDAAQPAPALPFSQLGTDGILAAGWAAHVDAASADPLVVSVKEVTDCPR